MNTVTLMATAMAKEVKVERDSQAKTEFQTEKVVVVTRGVSIVLMKGPLRWSNQVLYVTFKAPHYTVPF